MTPSIPHRIDSLIRALSDIVLPAIAADKSLAREQAQLVIAHLMLIQRQLPRAAAFDALEFEAAASLGRQLLELAAGNAALDDSRQALDTALSASARAAVTQDAIRQVNAAIEALVRAFRVHANSVASAAMTAAVFVHTHEKALRSRIWFASNAFDAERESLPGIESLFGPAP